MTTTPFTKIVRLGTVDLGRKRPDSVFAKIVLDPEGELHVTGVEGPWKSGNCAGGAGQIVMHYDTPEARAAITPAPGWTAETLDRFFEVWDLWHLNHMRAGSPAQTAFLRANPVDRQPYTDHYDRTKAALAAAGLQPDPGHLVPGPDGDPVPYSYGSAWLSEDVPDEVLEFLQALPDTDREPAWV